jgi:hypothetical protein
MKASNFLNFNANCTCPSCGEPLKLYMQLKDSVCFKAQFPIKEGEKEIVFKQFKCKDDHIGDGDIRYVLNESRLITDNKQIESSLIHSQFFFFFMCNEMGFNCRKSYGKTADIKEYDEYKIVIYDACYYRASIFFKCDEKDNDKLIFRPAVEANKKLINEEETFCFRKNKDNLEKIYFFTLDYLNNRTSLFHYTCNEEQRDDPNYQPNVFEKILPVLKRRPKFDLEDREQLLSRLDSWILLS